MMALIWHYTMLFYSEYMCTRRPARHFTKRSTAFSTFPLQLLHVYGGWRMCSMCCIVVERLNKFTTHTHCSCRKSEIVAPFFSSIKRTCVIHLNDRVCLSMLFAQNQMFIISPILRIVRFVVSIDIIKHHKSRFFWLFFSMVEQ